MDYSRPNGFAMVEIIAALIIASVSAIGMLTVLEQCARINTLQSERLEALRFYQALANTPTFRALPQSSKLKAEQRKDISQALIFSGRQINVVDGTPNLVISTTEISNERGDLLLRRAVYAIE